VAIATASTYDRVTILAASHAPAAVAMAAPPPTFQRPMPVDEGDEPINIQMPQQPVNSPVVGQFPMSPGMPSATPAGPQATPGAPLTSPRPGALPVPSGQPGVPNPYQPKPGGGGSGGQ
jgi:hypothetical protein